MSRIAVAPLLIWRLCIACLAGIIVACAGVPIGFGTGSATARANADELFGSFAARFTNVYRTPRYARARELLGRYALTPSVIYNDTSIWTAYNSDGTRTLFGQAAVLNNRYLFTNIPSSASLETPGDGRHVMRLHKLSDNTYEWFTGVDFAAGHLTAQDAANIISLWLASAEGHSGPELRTETHTAFPRTTAAIGKLFTIDTLISAPDNAGGNSLHLGIHLTPDSLRSRSPHYAAYLDKYVKRIKLRLTLFDKSGNHWLHVVMRDGYITMHLRSRDGHFVPLEGGVVQIPDTLMLRIDATAKIGLFTVGVNEMTGEWVNLQSEHERGWALRFTKEPDWSLPPTVGFFIRSPLRRPFQGAGTQFHLTIRDTPGHQTLISRRATTMVQESAILRFFGHLGGTAMGEFVSTAEEEENRFNASVFSAIQEDIDAILH
jgi:hypothetical protein